MSSDENQVSDSASSSVAQNWLWGNHITIRKKGECKRRYQEMFNLKLHHIVFLEYGPTKSIG